MLLLNEHLAFYKKFGRDVLGICKRNCLFVERVVELSQFGLCSTAGQWVDCLKCQSYSRAYIDFKRSEDVIEFAEFFDGHVFVNEKGTQFKVIVEYAPSQRVPKQWSKKDGREGTIGKDPEYLEFLEFVSKPVENLPSAEIQLERKEAERAGAAKEAPIVTPLMDFIIDIYSQKRRLSLSHYIKNSIHSCNFGSSHTLASCARHRSHLRTTFSHTTDISKSKHDLRLY
ncbi:nucleotide-binding alpha-beta plait domain-containing protein [Tanacetum coccineum]